MRVPLRAVALLFFVSASLAGADRVGRASWYGPGFFGRTMASGQRYDRRRVFVAHKWLPFGARVKIMNLKNHHVLIAPVEDRGPYAGRCILDLSYAAAIRLGIVKAGVAHIAYEIMPRSDL
ncbi:MAG TPA: septal ring lytic transglycosylase RlpA family protein [Candidatus Paceibacterota bacterium]|nr:septal ring lytic transglycosylase RlpA family protein [Candidatus Paceibacterota bacterium]